MFQTMQFATQRMALLQDLCRIVQEAVEAHDRTLAETPVPYFQVLL